MVLSRSLQVGAFLLPLQLCLAGCVDSRPLFDQDEDGFASWNDCDDQDATVGPKYRDLDGDGVGAGPWDAGCSQSDSEGYSTDGRDCNDQDAGVSPELPEICDQRDNNCDGLVDNDFTTPAPEEIFCDGIDNNCNGPVDDFPDEDEDGYPACTDAAGVPLDCDDKDPKINPDETETLGDLVDTNCNAMVDVIDTTYGNGMCCYDGDNIDAEHAILGNPGQMLYDKAGNLVFADAGSHRVRQISPSGIVSTLAGNGLNGFSGDNGDAKVASLASPSGIAFDSTGQLFIADTGNHVVRLVAKDGRITTVLGMGEEPGSALDNSDPLKSNLNEPTSVLMDSDGNVLVADSSNHRVLQYKPSTNTVIQVVGTGVQGYAGDGDAAAKAKLNRPIALLYYASKVLLIADSGNNVIRMVDNLGVISTFAGVGVAGYGGDGGNRTKAVLNHPATMVLDDRGQLFVADLNNHRIRLILQDGTIYTIAGAGVAGFAGDGLTAREALLNSPYGVAIDEDGFLVIGDTLNHRMRTVHW